MPQFSLTVFNFYCQSIAFLVSCSAYTPIEDTAKTIYSQFVVFACLEHGYFSLLRSMQKRSFSNVECVGILRGHSYGGILETVRDTKSVTLQKKSCVFLSTIRSATGMFTVLIVNICNLIGHVSNAMSLVLGHHELERGRKLDTVN